MPTPRRRVAKNSDRADARPPVTVVATAIHAGHDLRPELRPLMALDEESRFREEDPFTDRIAQATGTAVTAVRSRFEVDLNRPRQDAVYRSPEDCWGLEVWHDPLASDIVERSLAEYDDFYESLGQRLDEVAEQGPFILFDIHSYNHRREGPDKPAADQADNPDVNVGTGSLDRNRWGAVVDTLITELDGTSIAGRPLDVRENVRFKGANMARWVHDRYPTTGCALALEFKKTFMDEWTGELDEQHLTELAQALSRTVPAVTEAAQW